MNHVFAWPVGRVPDDERAPLAPVVAYVIGMVVGAVAVALTLSAAGDRLARLDGTSRLVAQAMLGAVAVLAVVLQARGRIAPLPERRRQVPRAWLFWRHRAATGLAFGLMLGVSVLTLLHHATIYVLAVTLVALHSPTAGALAGLVYGGVRSSQLVLAWRDPHGATSRRQQAIAARSAGIATSLPAIALATAVVGLVAANA
jgi:hypothetical protein